MEARRNAPQPIECDSLGRNCPA